jgi:hypothetical protein
VGVGEMEEIGGLWHVSWLGIENFGSLLLLLFGRGDERNGRV